MKRAEKIAIVGSGLVGCCWAIVFARGKYSVYVYDIQDSQLDNAVKAIKEKLNELAEANLLHGQSIEEILKRISTTKDLSTALDGATYVQECTPEDLELKKKVFENLDKMASPSTILASSTSAIPASKFTENLKHRSRCIVSHPINPPHIIPLIEIVPAPWTNPEVTEKTKKLMEMIGNKPIVLKKEVLGFAQNRLQYALLAESFRLVQDGVLSPGDVDTAVVYGLAARWSFMGPFQTIDLNAPKGVADYCQRYLGGIYKVLEEQDNKRKISEETVKKINEHQRTLYPLDDIPKVCNWRDRRLMALASHSVECKEIDKEKFSKL